MNSKLSILNYKSNLIPTVTAGQTLLWRGLILSLVLLLPLLTSGCGTSRVPQAPEVTVVENTQKVPLDFVRPRPVTERQLTGKFEAVVQTNIFAILDQIKAGDREPLNLMCVRYNDYLLLGEVNQDTLRYLQEVLEVFDSLDRQREDILRASDTPPD